MISKFRLKKGYYGYLTRKKKMLLSEVLLVLFGIIILLILGLMGTGVKHRSWGSEVFIVKMVMEITRKATRRNLLTIVAVVSVLPMAKQLVILLAVAKYKSRPKAEYDQVAAITKKGLLNTELVITSKTDKAIELNYAYIHEKGVFCYSTDKSLNAKKTEKYLRSFLKENELETDVFLIKDWKNYLNRLSSLPEEDRDTCDENLLRIEGVLRAIAI